MKPDVVDHLSDQRALEDAFLLVDVLQSWLALVLD